MKKETEKEKFQEREAKQRREAVAMLHKENDGTDSANATAPAEPKVIKSASMNVDDKKSPEKKKSNKSKMPAWALTESAAVVCGIHRPLLRT